MLMAWMRFLNFRENARKEDMPSIRYKIQNFEIELPGFHALPQYQRKYRLYDKYLASLAMDSGTDRLIIDIGANVGDTVALLCQHCNSKILAIEPDDLYFEYLRKNIDALRLADRVLLSKVPIGTEGREISLVRSAGTARPVSVEHNFGISVKTLKNTMSDMGLFEEEIYLVKIDTDGFDYDILTSSIDVIENKQPVLYWENTVDSKLALTAANKVLDELECCGYFQYACFDNFGALIKFPCDANFIRNWNDYLLFQAVSQQKAIYYMDVLAWTQKYEVEVTNSMKRYKEFSASDRYWPFDELSER
jgi:FkbM family methyltransferase